MNLFWGPACRLNGADSSLRSFENKEGKDLLVYVKAGDRHCEDSSVARVETRRNQTPQETWLAADVTLVEKMMFLRSLSRGASIKKEMKHLQ